MAARIPFYSYAVDASGDTISGSQIEVRRRITGGLATLYASDTGGTTLANPFTAGAGGAQEIGRVLFWVDPGLYEVTVGTSPTDTTDVIPLVASERTEYPDRGTLVADVAAGAAWPGGTIISDGDVLYKVSSGATAISDLPGLMPLPSGGVDAFIEHFIQTATDATTNISSVIQDAIDYAGAIGTGTFGQGGKLGFMSREYLLADTDADGYCATIANSMTLVGSGSNSTTLYINTTTDSMFYVGKGDAAILADTTNTEVVRNVQFQGLQFYNTSSAAPTSGCFVHADRADVEFVDCRMLNHYRGAEFLGSPENCRFIRSEIIQGSNAPARITFGSETAAFTVGSTLTWGGGSGTATIDAVDTGVLTVSNITFAASDSPLPVNGDSLTDADGGSATATSGFIAQPGSCGIFIGRRQVNSALAIAAQDPTDTLYYTEPNTIHITDSNIEMGSTADQYGGEYAILVDSCDTVAVKGSHIAWAAKACIGFVPAQANLSFSDFRVAGGLIDPLPGKSLHGVLFQDSNGVNPTVVGSISLANVGITGATKGSGLTCTMPTRRLNLKGVDIRQCGTYGIFVNNADAERILIEGCHLDLTSLLTGDHAAAYLNNGERMRLIGNSFDTGFRGVQLGTDVDRVVAIGNQFAGMTASFSESFSLPTDWAGEFFASNNDVQESATIASANRLIIPVGLEQVHITGTTTIYEIRADAPVNSAYPGRRLLLTFAGAVTLSDDAATPGGSVVPNLRLGSDITTAAGTVVELMYAPDIEAGKWVATSVRDNA